MKCKQLCYNRRTISIRILLCVFLRKILYFVINPSCERGITYDYLNIDINTEL